MKRKNFLLATLSLVASTAFAQYESPYKNSEADYSALDEIVGKVYWIKANPNAIGRKTFKTSLDLGARIDTDFVVTSDVSFKVVGWDLDSIKRPHLKVVFQDGKEAYIEVLLWDQNKEILENVFTGSDYHDWKEYFFKGNPDEILADWKKKKAKQKAQAQAEYKAKGGVKIGMTKAQVLKSNWGKPESVNTTTNAASVNEQWVYGGRNYLYFTNGVLTGIQN